MNIDILCNDGSPLGVTSKDIYGNGKRGIGVGGAELALLTMCENWHDNGHRVRLYNDPLERNASKFDQFPINYFHASEDRDILIVFRSPNPRSIGAKGKRIWWSCDQYTVGSFRDFAGTVEEIVVISPFHKRYFECTYKIMNSTVIDIPIRFSDYSESVEKVSRRCIFTSVPDRGLQVLHSAWPRIVRDVPDASLVITSDYRLWGAPGALNEQHKANWMHHRNVQFRGAMLRRDFVREQAIAELHLYPCVYDELFCISVAESQVAGVYPITSKVGALESTNMGMQLPGNPLDHGFTDLFVKTTVEYLLDDEKRKNAGEDVRNKARERFSTDVILSQWNKVFEA